jgi:RimJ/RimL family protein N-acetyltransferase
MNGSPMTELLWDSVRLVPATVHLLRLEDVSGAMLAQELGVQSPPSWPPEFNGPQTRAWVRERLQESPINALWLSWYIISQEVSGSTLAGFAGYKGPPDEHGQVEIGYSVVPDLRRRGLASLAVRALCEHAFKQGARSIIAHTLPKLVPSQGVLLKAGFQKTQVLSDPDNGEVWRYQLDPH